MENSMTAVERFKKAIKVNRFRMDEELEMLEVLVNKYNFLSVSEYARKEKISQPAALKRLKTGKIMFVEMINRKFIIG
jgi:hypothetical protein